MDPLKLLSRSLRPSRGSRGEKKSTPVCGQNVTARPSVEVEQAVSRKRKRGTNGFSGGSDITSAFDRPERALEVSNGPILSKSLDVQKVEDPHTGETGSHNVSLAPEDTKRVLRELKLKTSWLNAPAPLKDQRRVHNEEGVAMAKRSLYPIPLDLFESMRRRFGISTRLLDNTKEQGFTVPTEVQMASLPLLLDDSMHYFGEEPGLERAGIDLITVAPTGSGKTLAFMIALIHRTQQSRNQSDQQRRPLALVLAPTKELAGQIADNGKKLAKGTGIKVTEVKKGMRFTPTDSNIDVLDRGEDEGGRGGISYVKADILVATPGVMQTILCHGRDIKLASIQYLVLDESEILLERLFREQTIAVLNQLPHRSLRVSFWSATMSSNVEELASSLVAARQQERKAPLIRLVVGLKDSAVLTVKHELIYAATEQGKLLGLRQLLHPTSWSGEAGSPIHTPMIVFVQTIGRAVALHSELLYDIPAEAGGVDRIAVLHADLSDAARNSVMTRFRRGEVWVLITTDLLSRGVDFQGVNAVINYDIPTSSASYVHRVGRTGRASQRGGVAVTFYTKEDVPYLRHIANVLSDVEKQSKPKSDGQQRGPPKWLLDAAPALGKHEKQRLKKRGVQIRTPRTASDDRKLESRAKISTKAGFIKRESDRKNGASLGSKRRSTRKRRGGASGTADEVDFEGFD